MYLTDNDGYQNVLFFFSLMVDLPTLDDDKNVRLMNIQKIALA